MVSTLVVAGLERMVSTLQYEVRKKSWDFADSTSQKKDGGVRNQGKWTWKKLELPVKIAGAAEVGNPSYYSGLRTVPPVGPAAGPGLP